MHTAHHVLAYRVGSSHELQVVCLLLVVLVPRAAPCDPGLAGSRCDIGMGSRVTRIQCHAVVACDPVPLSSSGCVLQTFQGSTLACRCNASSTLSHIPCDVPGDLTHM